MCRRDSRQCYWREEAVLGRLGGGPYGAVDWTSARYLLFRQYHLGCSRAQAILLGRIRGAVLGVSY